MIDTKFLNFDERGRNIPFRDKSGCPIVDPSVLQVPEQITIDYAEFIKSKGGVRNPKDFVVSLNSFASLFKTSQLI